MRLHRFFELEHLSRAYENLNFCTWIKTYETLYSASSIIRTSIIRTSITRTALAIEILDYSNGLV